MPSSQQVKPCLLVQKFPHPNKETEWQRIRQFGAHRNFGFYRSNQHKTLPRGKGQKAWAVPDIHYNSPRWLSSLVSIPVNASPHSFCFSPFLSSHPNTILPRINQPNCAY